MKFDQFAPNLFMSEDPQFGDYSPETVTSILYFIDRDFSKRIGIKPFTSKICFIKYHPIHPMCCDFNGTHIIYLSVSGSLWSKWAYQFAHEYCHHLINGPLKGAVVGLNWFEESVCELASMCSLDSLRNEFDRIGFPYAPSVQDYLDDLMAQPLPTNYPGWLQSWLPLLSEPTHHREHNNAIARQMFPLFVENPSLWKIILHFGDTSRWQSLDELFEYLFLKAEDDYRDSLHKLHGVLFS